MTVFLTLLLLKCTNILVAYQESTVASGHCHYLSIQTALGPVPGRSRKALRSVRSGSGSRPWPWAVALRHHHTRDLPLLPGQLCSCFTCLDSTIISKWLTVISPKEANFGLAPEWPSFMTVLQIRGGRSPRSPFFWRFRWLKKIELVVSLGYTCSGYANFFPSSWSWKRNKPNPTAKVLNHWTETVLTKRKYIITTVVMVSMSMSRTQSQRFCFVFS